MVGNLKGLVLLSLVLALVSPLIVSLTAPSVLSTPDDPPDYIYLTWATPDTAHTINVSWRTDENYVGEVRYDNEPRGGNPGAYNYSAGGTGGLTTPKLPGYIHHVELTGLEPDTIYYFICGSSSHGWSDEQSFQTAPGQKKSFRFATGGDSRDDNRYDYHDYWPSARDDVSEEMAEHDPSFVLFLGDYLWSSENPGPGYAENDTWDNWLGAVFKYWRTSDNRLIPLIPVIGNHEIVYPEPWDYDPMTDAINYYTVFNLPGNERWYALSWGPDLRIIVLDSEVLHEGSDTWQEQLDWLESELENSENYPWTVVAYHRPFVTAVDQWAINYDQRIEDWSYRFTKYGVNLVMAGHIHWYERTCPIDSDPPSPWPEVGENAPPGKGVIYVVSGGWGGSLSSPASPQWFDVYGPAWGYHFCLVDIFENGTLNFQAIDNSGAVFDEFSIHRVVEVSVSPSESSALPGENVIFEVMVKNTGSTSDNYLLESVDNSGWTLELENNVLEVPAGGNRTTTLTVTIPENAEPGADDSIIVTATAQENENISDNDSCIAHATAPRAELGLVTLYEVGLDLDVYLENGTKLVVKFYKYGGTVLQAENVVWENVTPARVTLLENVSHPRGAEGFSWGTVQVARLVLTTDNTEEVISTLASLTVYQSDLKNRYIEILIDWASYPEKQPAFRAEIINILLQWSSAPP
jgi:hypothetical protein